MKWARFLFGMLVCTGLHILHVTLKLTVGLSQWIPGWTLISFWPRFYWHILTDPAGRSFRTILQNPRCTEPLLQRSLPRVSRLTRRRFLEKGKIRIQSMPSRYLLLSSYQAYGAYAHIHGPAHASDCEAAVAAATGCTYCDDPLRISVAYEYFRDLADEPPDNQFYRMLAFFGIVGLHACLVAYGTWKIIRYKRAKKATNPVPSHKAFSTSKDYYAHDDVDSSQYFDTDGIPYVIDNLATCIICNDRSQFVGNLRVQKTSVSTLSERLKFVLRTIMERRFHMRSPMQFMIRILHSTFWVFHF